MAGFLSMLAVVAAAAMPAHAMAAAPQAAGAPSAVR
jgi:hypothetical protein